MCVCSCQVCLHTCLVETMGCEWQLQEKKGQTINTKSINKNYISTCTTRPLVVDMYACSSDSITLSSEYAPSMFFFSSWQAIFKNWCLASWLIRWFMNCKMKECYNLIIDTCGWFQCFKLCNTMRILIQKKPLASYHKQNKLQVSSTKYRISFSFFCLGNNRKIAYAHSFLFPLSCPFFSFLFSRILEPQMKILKRNVSWPYHQPSQQSQNQNSLLLYLKVHLFSWNNCSITHSFNSA